jgi:coenzyme F420 hydrogenase subunit beta
MLLHRYLSMGINILARSADSDRRFNGSSGGVVSQMIVNHLEAGGYVITPQFNKKYMSFETKLIVSASDYEQVGSVYHHLKTVNFVRNLILENKNYLITCLPCEVKPINALFKGTNAKVITVALACSGQLEYEATLLLFKMMDINPIEIDRYRYRGGGWPGGMAVCQTQLKIDEAALGVEK